MPTNFKDTLEEMVAERIAAGEDPVDLFEQLAREANLVFGHYNLEYEFGFVTAGQGVGALSKGPMDAGRLAA